MLTGNHNLTSQSCQSLLFRVDFRGGTVPYSYYEFEIVPSLSRALKKCCVYRYGVESHSLNHPEPTSVSKRKDC